MVFVMVALASIFLRCGSDHHFLVTFARDPLMTPEPKMDKRWDIVHAIPNFERRSQDRSASSRNRAASRNCSTGTGADREVTEVPRLQGDAERKFSRAMSWSDEADRRAFHLTPRKVLGAENSRCRSRKPKPCDPASGAGRRNARKRRSRSRSARTSASPMGRSRVLRRGRGNRPGAFAREDCGVDFAAFSLRSNWNLVRSKVDRLLTLPRVGARKSAVEGTDGRRRHANRTTVL